MEHAHDADRAALARTIMRRQAKIGLRVAATFVLFLAGLPLLNLYVPNAMAARIGGFSLTWLTLGLLVYPVMWVLAWLFVRGSDRIESEIVAEFQGKIEALSSPAPSSSPSGAAETRGKRKLFVDEDEA